MVHSRSTADKNLLNIRLRVARDPADHVSIDRRIAPPQDCQPLFFGDPLQDAGAQHALLRIHGKKDHPHPVLAGCGQGEANACAFAGKERVRNLNQDSRAVTRLRIAATGAAMGEIDQHLDALQHDVVRFLAVDAGNEPDAAGVMLMPGAI